MFSFADTETICSADEFLSDLISTIELQTAKHQPSGHYKPSSMNCLRSMYYQALQILPDDGLDSHVRISMGQAGTDRHERIQKYVSEMEKMGKPCKWIKVKDYLLQHPELEVEIKKEGEFETKCYHPKYNLSFMCDGLIEYKGKIYILEIKTESIYKWIDRSGPATDHLKQISCYSLCFEIPDVMFLYENRDSCQKLAFTYHVDENQQKEIESRIFNCNEHVKKLVIPSKCDLKRFCTYCDYKIRCGKDK